MNAEIQNMIGVLIHVAKSDEFLDHEEKKVLKKIIYRYSVDSKDLKKIKNTQENLSEKLLKVKTSENKELVVKLSALIIASDGMITDVEKTTFKNIRNFLGEKESKYKDIMSEGELDRDKILEQELKIMNLLPSIESIN